MSSDTDSLSSRDGCFSDKLFLATADFGKSAVITADGGGDAWDFVDLDTEGDFPTSECREIGGDFTMSDGWELESCCISALIWRMTES